MLNASKKPKDPLAGINFSKGSYPMPKAGELIRDDVSNINQGYYNKWYYMTRDLTAHKNVFIDPAKMYTYTYRIDTYSNTSTDAGTQAPTKSTIFTTYNDPYSYGWTPAKSKKNGATVAAAATTKVDGEVVTLVDKPKSTRGGTDVFNPPPHAFTRGNRGNEYFIEPLSLSSVALAKAPSDALRLGTITLGSKLAQFASQGQLKFSEPWGFRFMYNPTTVGYSSTTDPSANAPSYEAMAASGTSLLIPATSTYQLELWLNRIPDMKKGNQNAKYYGARADLTELQQLWKRGTEYDLDYLYRVLNGDPRTVLGWGAHQSSNLGALFQRRVRLRIGEGFFVEGMINNITVNHLMLTDMMIPTLSQVTINFTQWYQAFVKDTSATSSASGGN
jgi:hypothetical protein